MLASVPDGVIVADRAGRLLGANRAALSLTGCASTGDLRHSLRHQADDFEVHDLAGRPVPPRDWPLARALRGETFVRVELRIRRGAGGEERVLSFGGGPVPRPAGREPTAVLAIRDVTVERARLEDRERVGDQLMQEHSQMVAAVAEVVDATGALIALGALVPVGVIVADAGGRVLLRNDAATTILGRKVTTLAEAAAACAALSEHAVDPDMLPLRRALVDAVAAESTLAFRVAGADERVTVRARPVRGIAGEIVGVVAVIERTRDGARVLDG
ncbi:MAG TPA: PAS domain-containing protein [Polyangia bacterium]